MTFNRLITDVYARGRSVRASITWRTLSAPPIEAVVHYGPPELAGDRDRRTWTQHLHDTVDQLREV